MLVFWLKWKIYNVFFLSFLRCKFTKKTGADKLLAWKNEREVRNLAKKCTTWGFHIVQGLFLILGELVLLTEHLLFVGTQWGEVAFPAWAEVDVPAPETAEAGLGVLSMLCAEPAVCTGFFVCHCCVGFEGYGVMRLWGWEVMRLGGYEVGRLWGLEVMRLWGWEVLSLLFMFEYSFQSLYSLYAQDG